MRPTFLVAGIVVLSCCSRASVILGPIINPNNGHHYSLLSPSSWTASEAEAVTLGGHLATVRSAAENQWIIDTFSQWLIDNRGGLGYVWIGLNDALSEGSFVWSSGEPVSYTNWFPGEPNNTAGIEDYVHISPPGGGTWNDADNPPTTVLPPFYGVAEVIPSSVPEPTTTVLLSLGLTLLLFKVRSSSRKD